MISSISEAYKLISKNQPVEEIAKQVQELAGAHSLKLEWIIEAIQTGQINS